MSATATEEQALVEPAASEAGTPVAAPSTAPQKSSDKRIKGKGKESKDKDKDKDAKDKDKDKDAKGKDAKGKKGNGKSKGEKNASEEDSGSPSVAAHPRAARAVAQAKGWGGLAGFFIAGYLSLPTGTLAQTGLRALIAGSVCYVTAWAGAVFVWRRLVIVEIKGREQALLADAQAALMPGEPIGAPAEPQRAGAASPGR
ncbi:MAG: hypothetical protein WAU42_12920 [Solirubrobacteraceae bacterium]